MHSLAAISFNWFLLALDDECGDYLDSFKRHKYRKTEPNMYRAIVIWRLLFPTFFFLLLHLLCRRFFFLNFVSLSMKTCVQCAPRDFCICGMFSTLREITNVKRLPTTRRLLNCTRKSMTTMMMAMTAKTTTTTTDSASQFGERKKKYM